MAGKNTVLAISAGMTLASLISSIGAGLVVYTIKRDGVLVQLPGVGRVDVKFDGTKETGSAVILPPSATSIMSVLPAIVGIAAVIGAIAAGAILSKDGAAPAAAPVPGM